jgi:hypothetical protein
MSIYFACVGTALTVMLVLSVVEKRKLFPNDWRFSLWSAIFVWLVGILPFFFLAYFV